MVETAVVQLDANSLVVAGAMKSTWEGSVGETPVRVEFDVVTMVHQNPGTPEETCLGVGDPGEVRANDSLAVVGLDPTLSPFSALAIPILMMGQ